MNFICLNGKHFPAEEPVLMADNRGYRYGDGLFETMKMVKGKIILEKFHLDRLSNGIKLLKFAIPPFFRSEISQQVSRLCKKNKCEDLARIRLSLFRGNGALQDQHKNCQYLVECWPADPALNQINKTGLAIDIFPDMQKACDPFSNLKTANYLPYIMASQYASKHRLDDCLVTNIHGHVADATIANIFLVKNKLVITPALSEGCVNGVMRRYLIQKLKTSDFDLREGVVTKNDLEAFDEVFLTNALKGIRWVKSFRKKRYDNTTTLNIYEDLVMPLYR